MKVLDGFDTIRDTWYLDNDVGMKLRSMRPSRIHTFIIGGNDLSTYIAYYDITIST